ncbi:MAG: amidohydrolase family protein [Polyangiales bacterium]
MKKRSWLSSRKKTAVEVPYEPPFWFGDHSNGEQYHQATPRERHMRALILQKGAEAAKRHGMERREFMASGLGVALSMSVMNLVNGCSGGSDGGFSLGSGQPSVGDDLGDEAPSHDDSRALDAGNGAGRMPSARDGGTIARRDAGMPVDPDPVECEALLDASKTFIFDIQTHRVETAGGVYRTFLSILPQASCGKGVPGCFSRDEYVRELFLESDTTMTVLSGVPALDGGNPLTNEQIAETRDFVNGLASDSQRMITHAMVLPNYNHAKQLEGMARIAGERGPIGAWKCYTPWGPGNGVSGFWLDDPATGIPFIEKGREVGIKTFCCHKGLPLPGFDNSYGDPKDIGVVAKRYPDCNFVVYHSAYQFGSGNERTPYTMGSKAGVNSLVTACLQNGHGPGSNIYGELGTTWFSVMRDPTAATHILGKLLKYLGEDNIVWGTDSMWYGSPQPQILAFLNFKMDQRLREAHGYPDLTPAIKAKVLGLNAAKVFGVDPSRARCVIDESAIAQHKRELDGEFGKYRWAYQQPRMTNRRDFFRNMAMARAAKRPG